jgi:hypothetical protein
MFSRIADSDAARMRERAVNERDRVRRATPRIQRLARGMADLPPDEFARRVSEAFRPRH